MNLNSFLSAYSYSPRQWVLFFFIYCFIGWVWETSYVSIRDKRFQNRGFMRGPFLPIYGSGALMILVSTLPFRNNVFLVFLFGMIGATLLELCTGILMEQLFKVKYWDYSNRFLNYKGHICLKSSIAWGIASVCMMYGFHKPIEKFVLGIPERILNPVTFFMAIGIAADFSTCFKAALDLRRILVTFDKAKEEISALSKRVAFLENKSVTDFLKRNPDAVSKQYSIALEEYRDIFIKRIKDSFGNAKEVISEKLSDTKELVSDKLSDTKELVSERLEDTKEMIVDKLSDTKESIEIKLDELKESSETNKKARIAEKNEQ